MTDLKINVSLCMIKLLVNTVWDMSWIYTARHGSSILANRVCRQQRWLQLSVASVIKPLWRASFCGKREKTANKRMIIWDHLFLSAIHPTEIYCSSIQEREVMKPACHFSLQPYSVLWFGLNLRGVGKRN